MRRKSLAETPCPIARSLDHVGEWWSILILRDAFHGLTRFDQFERSLEIAPNMLARRLRALVAAGLLAKHRYNDRPPRHEYRLTRRGRDFWPVLVALMAWGNRHFAEEGIAVELRDTTTGEAARPTMIDAVSGKPLDARDFRLVGGPAADEAVRERLAFAGRAVRRPPESLSTTNSGES